MKDSEHKRHESLRKNLELQKRVLELEEDLKQARLKIKEIIVRKAPVILREQYIQLENDYNVLVQQLRDFQDKEDRFVDRVQHVKATLKQENDRYRIVIDQERSSLFKQIDNYKLLLAEFKTENQDLKNLVVDLRKQVSIANHLAEAKEMDAMSE